MKKKILFTITLAFVMFFNVFAGCSFIKTDTTKYYNTIVAKVGDSEITKYELLSNYNSYGYDYVQSSGYTVEEAVETVLNQLINREVLAKYLSENYLEIFGEPELKKYEISEIWQNVFDSVNGELLEYYNTIRKNQGLEEIKDDDESISTETEYLRQDFVPSIKIYRNANNEITKITKVATSHDVNLDVTIGDFEFKYYGESSKLNDRMNELAQKQYYTYLKINHNDDKLENNQEILTKYLEKNFNNYKKSYMIEKYEEYFNNDKEISLHDILEKYKDLVKIDYQKYGDVSNKSDYISAVQSDASTVYFHPYEDELIYVSHILVKYDKSKEDYDLKQEYKDKLANGEIDQTEYNNIMANQDVYLGAECEVYQMVDGVFEENPTDMNAVDLYRLIDADLSKVENDKERLDKFIDYAYQYNQDTAMFSSNAFYTIQLDKENYADTMVEEFADLSRKIYNEQGAGNYGICYTNYGAHIVYVVGKVENNLVNSMSQLDTLTIEQLFNVELTSNQYNFISDSEKEENGIRNKTLLDEIAGFVKISDYNIFIQIKLNEIKNEMGEDGVIIYKNRYKDMLES
ncbi:MAG: SurA N-terminal domain-containing protein [Clostridia bacterium]|nr:SurA N-terminal domain-containing protein [Clostridia bacterium]